MKLIVAGSRYWDETRTEYYDDEEYVFNKLDKIHAVVEITEVVCGKAKGADSLGEKWAKSRGVHVEPFEVTSIDWKTFGKGAGHRRNRQMGDYADAAVIFWNGTSNGSDGMNEYMKKLKKPVRVYKFRKKEE